MLVLLDVLERTLDKKQVLAVTHAEVVVRSFARLCDVRQVLLTVQVVGQMLPLVNVLVEENIVEVWQGSA